MNNTQDIKSRATLLQKHLAEAGLSLARTKAIGIVAKLDGYRSYNVARHGAAHAETTGSKPVLARGGSFTDEVKRSYVALGGAHCPNCGSHDVRDAMDAEPDADGWTFRLHCGQCERYWWAAYRNSHIVGLGLSKGAQDAFKKGVTQCPCCGHDDIDYESPTAGAQVLQRATCKKCSRSWVEVLELVDIEPPEYQEPARFIFGTWEHFFDGRSTTPDYLRFVFDTKKHKVILLQVLDDRNQTWRTEGQWCRDDLDDSLKNANGEALHDPESWGLDSSDEAPDWKDGDPFKPE